MSALGREFRLVPVVMFAAICLFTLKMIGLVADGGYVLSGARSANAQTNPSSWAQQMFNYPERSHPTGAITATGSLNEPPAEAAGQTKPGSTGGQAKSNGAGGAAKPEAPAGQGKAAEPAGQKSAPGPSALEKPEDKAAAPPAASGGSADGAPASPLSTKIDLSRPPVSAGERAVLERLQERRQELESRARDLDLREGLLKAAEKRLESRIGELKDLETRINGGLQKKEEAETTRFKGLITMYENMKAKEAARIFDRLDLKILVEVATQINPRRMSDIMAQMTPEAAERLTVEFASRASDRTQATADLPKIEGRPSNN